MDDRSSVSVPEAVQRYEAHLHSMAPAITTLALNCEVPRILSVKEVSPRRWGGAGPLAPPAFIDADDSPTADASPATPCVTSQKRLTCGEVVELPEEPPKDYLALVFPHEFDPCRPDEQEPPSQEQLERQQLPTELDLQPSGTAATAPVEAAVPPSDVAPSKPARLVAELPAAEEAASRSTPSAPSKPARLVAELPGRLQETQLQPLALQPLEVFLEAPALCNRHAADEAPPTRQHLDAAAPLRRGGSAQCRGRSLDASLGSQAWPEAAPPTARAARSSSPEGRALQRSGHVADLAPQEAGLQLLPQQNLPQENDYREQLRLFQERQMQKKQVLEAATKSSAAAKSPPQAVIRMQQSQPLPHRQSAPLQQVHHAQAGQPVQQLQQTQQLQCVQSVPQLESVRQAQPLQQAQPVPSQAQSVQQMQSLQQVHSGQQIQTAQQAQHVQQMYAVQQVQPVQAVSSVQHVESANQLQMLQQTQAMQQIQPVKQGLGHDEEVYRLLLTDAELLLAHSPGAAYLKFCEANALHRTATSSMTGCGSGSGEAFYGMARCASVGSDVTTSCSGLPATREERLDLGISMLESARSAGNFPQLLQLAPADPSLRSLREHRQTRFAAVLGLSPASWALATTQGADSQVALGAGAALAVVITASGEGAELVLPKSPAVVHPARELPAHDDNEETNDNCSDLESSEGGSDDEEEQEVESPKQVSTREGEEDIDEDGESDNSSDSESDAGASEAATPGNQEEEAEQASDDSDDSESESDVDTAQAVRSSVEAFADSLRSIFSW